jgi:flagellar hook-associated protein 3 FlgL
MRVDPNYNSVLAASLNSVQDTEEQLTSELSSGVSVSSLSDNPAAVGENVILLNTIQQDDTFTQSSSLGNCRSPIRRWAAW